jgi:hypothetical protein
MRKLLILAVAALLAVAIAAPSFAAETTFEGQYKIRAWSSWNFVKSDASPTQYNSDHGVYTGYFDQRFRLTITHARSEFLKAVVQIDLVEDTWGQQRNFYINNKTDGSLIRKAYIEFTLPKAGTFTVGKQPVVLGYGLAFSDSSGYLDGLKWSNKWGPLGVSAMYFKWDDNVDDGITDHAYNRDTDVYLLDLVYTPNENHTIELFGGYVNMRGGLPQTHDLAYNIPNSDSDHSQIGLVGIAYTGEIADMLTLKGEFSYLFGRGDYDHSIGVAWDDTLLSGYNLYLDASYHNDLLRAGMAFVTGSGQTEHGWGARHINVNFITADEFVFGNIIASGNGGLNDDFGAGLGFCDDIENLTAAKLYFTINPTEKLSLNAAVIWARWTEHVGGNTPYAHPVDYYYNDFTSWYGSKTDLGWEVDFGLSYQIMEGLTYSLATGVLFTGDSYDYMGTGVTHQEWGPMWMVNNELLYEF